jgi:hypothetical protein
MENKILAKTLPEGGEDAGIGNKTYVKYGGTYYRPVQADGRNKYEAAEVKDGDS